MKFDPATGVTVSHCSHNTCTKRDLCVTEFAPDPHNNKLKEFEEFMRPYCVAVDPKSTDDEREEALLALNRLRVVTCFDCRADRKWSRKEGNNQEARLYRMRLQINEDLKKRVCVDCGASGGVVPLECDHVTDTHTAYILDEKAWYASGKTPEEMWDEYINHTVPRCKFCHLLRDNHAKQVWRRRATARGTGRVPRQRTRSTAPGSTSGASASTFRARCSMAKRPGSTGCTRC